MAGEDFSRLLAEAKSGDRRAVAQLHDAFARRVLARIRGRMPATLRSRLDPEDVWSATFQELLERLPDLRDEGDRALLHWLYLVAERKLLSESRRRRDREGRLREEALGTSDAGRVRARGKGPATSVADSDLLGAMERVLASFDAKERALLVAGSAGRPDWRAVAADLGLRSADAARKRYARLLALVTERCRRMSRECRTG